jgi:hypothetical protein
MSDVVLTVVLALVAAVTAGLWLSLLTWPIGFVVNMVNMRRMNLDGYDDAQDVRYELHARGYLTMMALSQIIAFATVTVVGIALGLPWYAAAIAGLFVGLTSFVRSG